MRKTLPKSEDRCDVRLPGGRRCRSEFAVRYVANGVRKRLCADHWRRFAAYLEADAIPPAAYAETARRLLADLGSGAID